MRKRNRLERMRNDQLIAALNQQGRRIDWFAQQMGVSRWAFWRFETGRSAPPNDWYERAAEILGVNVDDVRPQEQVAA